MAKFDVIKFIKGASLVASLLGMAGSAYASSEENKRILEKLVKETLGK